MLSARHSRFQDVACATTLLLLLIGPSAHAQSASGDIQGTIVDQSGAVLPGVTITVTNTATGVQRELVTDAEGRFAAPGLQVGPYEVTAALQGFATRRQENLRVQIGETSTLRLELGVAALSDTITVSGTAPVLETTRTQVSSVVNSTAVANLPVNGRNFIDFVLLTPGVTRDTRSGDISFAGQRGTLNSLVVDGADNNNTFFGQALGRTGTGRAPYQFSQEAVQEFQVNANAFSAEFGRAGGAVINVVTRSGTNRFSGSVFEFYRDKALNANTAINESLGRPKSPYHYNQFGGVLGGPLVRDRHFFFANYDGQRNTQPNVVFMNVPANVPGDPLTQQALRQLEPLAASWERTQNQDTFLIKTDHQLTNDHRVTLRYNHQNFVGENFENGGTQQSFETTGASKVYTRSFNGTVASVVGSSLFNEVRFQWARDREPGEANSENPQADVRQGGTLVLRIGRNFFSPRETTVDRVQVADTLTWVQGAHKVKAGFDVQMDEILNYFPGNFSGVYVFQTLAGFATGVPNGAGDTYAQAFPGEGTTGPRTQPDINETSLFVQDEWRASDSITVNAGLRYDRQKLAQPAVRNPDAQLAAAGIDTSFLNTDNNNVGPRLGVAWAPVGRRYVVRAGYGLFYGRTPSIMVGTAHSSNGINVQTITFVGSQGNPVPTYPNRFSSIPAGVVLPRPTIFAFDPDYQNARTQQASTGFEWEWMPNTSVSVNYLFVKGDNLPRSTDINIGTATPLTFTVAGTGERLPHYQFAAGPFSNFTRVISFQSTAESRYNGITAELNRRFSQGYQFRLAYTLGKVEDTVPDATAVVPESSADDRKYASNPADFDVDRAPGSNDQRHRFVGSVIYTTDTLASRFGGWMEDLLRDWTLSAIFTMQSGQPYSAYVSNDINLDRNRSNDIAPGTTRNAFRFPMQSSFDPRVARNINLGATRELTLIWEAFNLLNRANYTVVDQTLYAYPGTGTTLTRRAEFGQRLNQADPRIMQLAAKFSF
ncbi:MAG TPA: carboxypeptidase regulatory-like domain-containing protein [Vicinamibacterales bacterium]